MTRWLGVACLAVFAAGFGAVVGHRHVHRVEFVPPVRAVTAAVSPPTTDGLDRLVAASDAALRVCEMP